jgi:hypothetical protein
MYVHTLSNIYNQFHIGIVIIVGASWDLDVLICHSNVVCVCMQIFWCSHDGKLNGSLVAEGLVRPFSYRPNLLDCRNTVVGNQDLMELSVEPGAIFRAQRTFVMTV